MTAVLRKRREWLAFGAFAVVLAVFPFVASTSVINVAVYALIYGLAAIGLSLLMGLAGQVSLGQAAFFAVGAYTHAILITRYEVNGVLAAVAGTVAAMIVAFIVGLPLLRLRGHYLALATLGLGIIVSVVVRELDYTGRTSGIFGIPKPAFNGRVYDSPTEFFFLLAPVVFVGLLLARNLVKSRVGRALSAVNDSEVAAECLGVNTFRLRLKVFVLSAGYAGLAGAFYAYWLGVVSPQAAGFELSVQFLLMVVLGGLGTVWGAITGAVLVEALDEGLRDVIPLIIPGARGEVQLIGFGIVLVAVVIFMPGGLHELTRRIRRLLGRDAHVVEPPRAPAAHAAAGVLAERAPRDGALLSVRGLTKRYGGVVAVDGVAFDVAPGEILALIGPNGAGKTTCFNMISGVLAPTAGTIEVAGQHVEGRPANVVAALGATRTFQNLQVFKSSSVVGNVRVGRHLRSRAGLARGMLGVTARREEREIETAAREAVALVGLESDAERPVADLPFGRQRLVEVARALALEPDLLLLDEPMAGLSGNERSELADLLRRVRAAGIAVVLVEHDVEAVLALADRVAVLDDGRLIALGTPDEVRADPIVVAAYLGTDDDADRLVHAAADTDEVR